MYRVSCLVVLLGLTGMASAQSAAGVSERDFLSDMPIVLSVSRMPQRLDEAPGAVTVIDREAIRLSGARDVADLLRLVPGFQSSMAFEGIAPQVSYHGGFGGYSNRIQVLIDGRSAYSPYFIGSVEPGLQSVALADIERIEVLRGSNSAAYGARAFLGVINIVTRHTIDTLGAQASANLGNNGIRDAGASLGWGTGTATFRLGMDTRADQGLLGAVGTDRVRRVNFRSDLRLNNRDELELRAGAMAIDAGKGSASDVDNLARDTRFQTAYLQLDWRRALSEDADLRLNYSHAGESYRDTFPYSLAAFGLPGSLDIDLSGRGSNDTLSLVHTWRAAPTLRVVWGGEWRRERIQSAPLYNSDATLATDFSRLFGNAEWRLAPELIINAGAMAENSSTSGSNFAPRLMLNWHVADGQTLRGGVSKAYRPPSTYEQFADVRYTWQGMLLQVNTLASGTVRPESVRASELGYLGDFPTLGVNLDVRAFHELIGGFIEQKNAVKPKDYANRDDFAIRGLEYQLKWRPWAGAQLALGQAWVNIDIADQGPHSGSGMTLVAPKLATTLSFFQKLPGGLDLSLMHQDSGTRTLQGAGRDDQSAMTRTDLRLGAPLRLGSHRGELALVVQNLGSPYPDFAPKFMFGRRVFASLQIAN